MTKTLLISLLSISAFSAQASLLVDSSKTTDYHFISQRMESDHQAEKNPFSISTHKMNYLLPVSYSDNMIYNPYALNDHGTGYADEINSVEAKFQISIKMNVARDLLRESDSLYFGFTATSWWQIYSEEISRPFRNTDYNPELFYQTPIDYGFNNKNHWLRLGLEHISNGETQELSRSLNRVYLQGIAEHGRFITSIKTWYRIPEEPKDYVLDPKGDDNPDLYVYEGYQELETIYKKDKWSLMAKARYNFNSNKGFLELGATYPINDRVKFYVQASTGYGESLIEYNHNQQRIGLGFSFSDLL